MTRFDPWHVVETHYNHLGVPVVEVRHVRVSGVLLTEQVAKQFAHLETARHINADPRRAFRAEPALGGTP